MASTWSPQEPGSPMQPSDDRSTFFELVPERSASVRIETSQSVYSSSDISQPPQPHALLQQQTAPKDTQAAEGSGGAPAPATAPLGNPQPSLQEHPYSLVLALISPEKREAALLELSKRREQFPDLAPILWHTYGTMACLLQEIVTVFPMLSPPSLTAHASNRVCNALALMQCVASHPDTRSLFIESHMALYLYPALNTSSKNRPFEYLRLTSLGVIGALVKVDDEGVIHFLLQTEIIPLCLRIMEGGSELSKTVATFIVQKVLLDATGLSYICATAERFYAVSTVLSHMVSSMIEVPSARLLKHIARCYLRLTDNPRAREALRQCLPESLRDDTFAASLRDDPSTKKWIQQIVINVSTEPPVSHQQQAFAQQQQQQHQIVGGNAVQ